MPGGSTVSVYYRTLETPEANLLRDITIAGNTFTRPGGAAIRLDHVTGCTITGNRFTSPVQYTALARPDGRGPRQAVFLSGCENVRLEKNVLAGADEQTAIDPLTGSRILGIDKGCREIHLDGKRVQ
jgi:hypothetical protein